MSRNRNVIPLRPLAVPESPLTRALRRWLRPFERLHDAKEVIFSTFFTDTRAGRWIKANIPADVVSFSRIPIGFWAFWLMTHGSVLDATVWYLIGALTDFVDGPLARAQNTAGPRGMLIESFADLVLHVLAFTGMWTLFHDRILLAALWLEVARGGGTLIGIVLIGLGRLNANLIGKLKAVAYFVGIPLYLLGAASLGSPLIQIGIGLCGLSLLIHSVVIGYAKLRR